MFGSLLVVVAVAFAAPFILGLFPRLRLPSVVLELIAGIIIGPSVLGIVHDDTTIAVMALIGLAFLLFLAGLEIEFPRLRGQVLRLTATGFVLSFAIALGVGLLLQVGGLIQSPLLVAIILCATSLGVLIPVLKDAGQISSMFGQLVIAAGTIADFGAVILLSIFFSGEGGVGATVLLLGALAVFAIAVFLVVVGAERSMRISVNLRRLQDTTAQIRVRGAMVLLIAFAAVAEKLGLETILGAFMAGAVLTLVDRDQAMTHPDFRRKLEAIGFGVFIPVFFVTSGIRYDLQALLATPSNLLMVPIFLAALVAVRGIPALVYRRAIDGRQTLVAALMQATSLPFIVAASAIGVSLHLLTAAESAALIAAGLLSVLLFPLIGLTLLRRGGAAPRAQAAPEEPAPTMAM
jgi:Kef-type K+ transport system membrane component KefB